MLAVNSERRPVMQKSTNFVMFGCVMLTTAVVLFA